MDFTFAAAVQADSGGRLVVEAPDFAKASPLLALAHCRNVQLGRDFLDLEQPYLIFGAERG